MNREEAFRKVTEYWALVGRGEKSPPLSGERRAVVKAANQDLHTINKVLHGLAPTLLAVADHNDVAARLAGFGPSRLPSGYDDLIWKQMEPS